MSRRSRISHSRTVAVLHHLRQAPPSVTYSPQEFAGFVDRHPRTVYRWLDAVPDCRDIDGCITFSAAQRLLAYAESSDDSTDKDDCSVSESDPTETDFALLTEFLYWVTDYYGVIEEDESHRGICLRIPYTFDEVPTHEVICNRIEIVSEFFEQRAKKAAMIDCPKCKGTGEIEGPTERSEG